MCIFSGDITTVSSTHIFARAEGASQFLVYQMTYAATHELAMVLPLPVALPSTDRAVQFISLEAYPQFFADMHVGFPARGVGWAASTELSTEELVVHDVGQYEASYVPSLASFTRLDRRFQVPAHVWDRLPEYSDYGFSVFKLKPSANPQEVHPMALRFPRRTNQLLYFPTLHVHDGVAHAEAQFDHTLYCQADDLSEYLAEWLPSPQTAGHFMDISLASELVLPACHVWRKPISGLNTNTDSCVGSGAVFPKAV